MKIAVIGGGINGVMVAWRLARAGHAVRLLERDRLMAATSAASSKLLHGGLRYLENGELRLVREALRERAWWIAQAPQAARALEILLPVYRDSPRPRWQIGFGLRVYQWLAGDAALGPSEWLNAQAFHRLSPEVRTDGLHGGYRFHDGQMNDYALGIWASQQAQRDGVVISEHTTVDRVDTRGSIHTGGSESYFDRVINVAGPWAGELLARSGVTSSFELDLVRGSHLVLDGVVSRGYMLQAPGRRVVFVLPYEGEILLGTTEVRQDLAAPIRCDDVEVDYLLGVYNTYFSHAKPRTEIRSRFAGVRPLLRSADNPTRATREYAIERRGNLISVFGGKWTTSRALAERVHAVVN